MKKILYLLFFFLFSVSVLAWSQEENASITIESAYGLTITVATPTPTTVATSYSSVSSGGSGGSYSTGSSTTTSSKTESTTQPTVSETKSGSLEEKVVEKQSQPITSIVYTPEGPVTLLVSRQLRVESDSKQSSGYASTISISLKNTGNTILRNYEVREKIPFIEFTSPNPLDYSIKWSPVPDKIERGSVIAVFFIKELAPQQEFTANYTLDKKLNETSLNELKEPTIEKIKPTPTPIVTQKTTETQTKTENTSVKQATSSNLLIPLTIIAITIMTLALIYLKKKEEKKKEEKTREEIEKNCHENTHNKK